MNYVYPDALLEIVKQWWDNIPYESHKSHKIVQLPEDKDLLNLFHIAFQASLLSEERRSLSFRIGFCTPQELHNDLPIYKRNRPLLFSKPRLFSVSELLRLAPATDPSLCLIGVAAGDNGLQVWGLVDTGLSWWEHTRGERWFGMSPPNCLTVTSEQSGELTVSYGSWGICRLRQGTINFPMLDVC